MPVQETDKTTAHYERVKEFMRLAKQTGPENISLPDSKTRFLRAKLILEEAMETVRALGFNPYFIPGMATTGYLDIKNNIGFTEQEPNLVEILDGCADISVVTIGTLIACGCPDKPLLEEVDRSNLSKFSTDYSFREDGKLLKGKDFVPPDIRAIVNNNE